MKGFLLARVRIHDLMKFMDNREIILEKIYLLQIGFLYPGSIDTE